MARKAQSAEITVKIAMVPHGYQIDFFDQNGKELGSECRDFGGDYDPAKIKFTFIAAILNAIKGIEGYFPRAERFSRMGERKQVSAQVRSRLIRQYIFASLVDPETLMLVGMPLPELYTSVRTSMRRAGEKAASHAEIDEELMILCDKGVLSRRRDIYSLDDGVSGA
jgi:hypothetical protein